MIGEVSNGTGLMLGAPVGGLAVNGPVEAPATSGKLSPSAAQLGLVVQCVYGDADVMHVVESLIPSLATATERQVTCYTINYDPGSSHRIASGEYGGVAVHDITNQAVAPTGFAANHNALFRAAQPSPFFVIIKPDCIATPGCLDKLIEAKLGRERESRQLRADEVGGQNHPRRGIVGQTRNDSMAGLGGGAVGSESAVRVAIVESRQWPFEHPKEFDALTHETPWASGACLLIDSEFYRVAGGMAEEYFLYCEDVDLSWRAWDGGWQVLYEPESVVIHFSDGPWREPGEVTSEVVFSLSGDIALARKFFGAEAEAVALEAHGGHEDQELASVVVNRYQNELKARVPPGHLGEHHPKIKIVTPGRYHEFN